MDINFYLPDFWNKKHLNLFLIDLIKSNPEYFYDNIKIAAVYGSFPQMIWNGGRTLINEDCGLFRMKETIDAFNQRDVAIRYTWSNCLIKEKHLDNFFCNFATQLADNGKNEIIVNSPILESYLKEKYPNFKYISSTTKCLTDNESILKELDNYYLTVLDYNKNIDIDFLKSIEKKDKVELLINPYCMPNCQQRKRHYVLLAQSQLENRGYDISKCLSNTYFKNFYDILEYPTVIKEKDLYDIYNKELGFFNFKIEGRSNSMADVIESYIYYLVKPEYKDIVRLKLNREVAYGFYSN